MRFQLEIKVDWKILAAKFAASNDCKSIVTIVVTLVDHLSFC